MLGKVWKAKVLQDLALALDVEYEKTDKVRSDLILSKLFLILSTF